ncbi:MAG: hypothetical protein KW804_02210 [Candidatus Doudnabacteria bacterium]|nr:hypothetical protein [Candidatus Doudnabacteria bacterium]
MDRIKTKIVNVFLIAIFSFVFCIFNFQTADAVLLYSQAANQDIYEGQTFLVEWFLDTEGKAVNTIDLKINYSKDTLEASTATAGSSQINIWIKNPTIEDGKISLIGGITNGLKDNKILLFKSVFTAKQKGQASVTLDPESKILLNDGRGTEDILKFRNILFNIYPKEFIPVKITSPSHPDSNAWYKNNDVQIVFEPKEGIDYSYRFSNNVELIPDDKKDDVSNLHFDDRPDGIHYFKLNSKTANTNWQETGVYRIQIDTTAPESFESFIGSDPSVFEGKPFLSFSTLDKTSGMSHYKVKVGLFGRLIETQSPYKLKKPIIGDEVVVTAYDLAGNSIDSKVKWPGYISVMTFKLILVLVGVLVLLLPKLLRKKYKNNA